MKLRRSVILLGYRGCGKSTLGRALAQGCGAVFVDTDPAVLACFGGRSVAEVWTQHGEATFRAAEAQVVVEAVAHADAQARLQQPQVVALGGGAVTEHPAGRAAVEAAHALRVYLHARPDVLAARIAHDPASVAARPSLTGSHSATDEVAAVLARRDPIYRAVADLTLDVEHPSVDQLITRIARAT